VAQLRANTLDPIETESIATLKGTRSEISPAELLTILLKRKLFILAVTLACAIVTAIVVSFMPPIFKAEATILLPQQQQSSLAALSGSLGGLAGSSVASSLGLKNPGDLYIGILGSRTISDDIVNRFSLKQVYGKTLASETRKALGSHVSFASGKDSLISIAVEDHDPQRAADMANAFVDELYKQNSRLAITDASHRRLFFEQELNREKEALSAAEIALKNTEQTTGMLAPVGQTESLIRSEAQLRAEIASREVRLQAMRSYATDENPQIQRLKTEVGVLQGQLGQMEAKSEPGSSASVSAGKLTDSSLEYIRKFRDVKYHETLFDLLAKQYEAARIDEAKEAPVIQVMDHAIVPDRKSSPNRTLSVEISFAAGLFCSILFVFLQDAFMRRDAAPEAKTV